jgi:hypothetical protein
MIANRQPLIVRARRSDISLVRRSGTARNSALRSLVLIERSIRSPPTSGGSALKEHERRELDSGLRRNDEQEKTRRFSDICLALD